MNRDILSIVIVCVLIGFGIYELYRGTKEWIEHKKAREAFLEANKKLEEYHEEYKLWLAFYIVLAVIGVVGAVYQIAVQQDLTYSLGFVVLTCICISFSLDCLVKRRAWFYDDGFFYEKKYYRYKSVSYVDKKRGFRAGYDVAFFKDPSMVVTSSMAEKIKDRMKNSKKKKRG